MPHHINGSHIGGDSARFRVRRADSPDSRVRREKRRSLHDAGQIRRPEDSFGEILKSAD
jgi:hypothetical protein